jgi:hypothetical protein
VQILSPDDLWWLELDKLRRSEYMKDSRRCGKMKETENNRAASNDKTRQTTLSGVIKNGK